MKQLFTVLLIVFSLTAFTHSNSTDRIVLKGGWIIDPETKLDIHGNMDIVNTRIAPIKSEYNIAPGDALSCNTIGDAEISRLAIFVTALSPEFVSKDLGYFTATDSERGKARVPIIYCKTKSGSITVTNGVTQFGRSRKILIFSNNQSLAKTQLSWLMKDSSGVAERDIVIVSVKEGSSLWSQYGVASNQFTIILIGKDGGEKFRSSKPETTKILFAIVDAMPMRQSEIKKRN